MSVKPKKRNDKMEKLTGPKSSPVSYATAQGPVYVVVGRGLVSASSSPRNKMKAYDVI